MLILLILINFNLIVFFFIELYREIASAIKKLLDCVNEISTYTSASLDRQALENRKRDFIKYSKKFSTTLKEYFREGESSTVYMSAAHLIYQTNLIQITVKNSVDRSYVMNC